jgi:hypothetical protein
VIGGYYGVLERSIYRNLEPGMVQTNHEPMPTGGMEVTVIYGGHGFEVDLLMRHYMEGCCTYHSDFVMSYAPGLRISCLTLEMSRVTLSWRGKYWQAGCRGLFG